jgi:hypothetical protein
MQTEICLNYTKLGHLIPLHKSECYVLTQRQKLDLRFSYQLLGYHMTANNYCFVFNSKSVTSHLPHKDVHLLIRSHSRQFSLTYAFYTFLVLPEEFL